MPIRPFDLLWDAPAVFTLWERALGGTYPLDSKTFLAHVAACLAGRPDGACVSVEDGEVTGFALTERSGPTGCLHALLVSPDRRRQRVGTRLLEHMERQLRSEGCTKLHLGRGPQRLWTALPDDLPNAAAFFSSRGFVAQGEVADLVIDLASQRFDVYGHRLAEAGAEVVACTRETLPEVLRFEQREFPGWVSGILRLAAMGEEENVLVVRTADEIVGTIQTFPPTSRLASPNLVWRAAFHGALGGYGAVGIAKAWRGKGLGIAMCEVAGERMRHAGADTCFIDWTAIVDFYARVGARVWHRFTMMEKDL